MDINGVNVETYLLKNDFTKMSHPIKYIVIHYTAGISSKEAKNTVSGWNNAVSQASANYVVDRNKIVHTVQDDELVYTWHCGTTGKYYHPKCRNTNSIGIEMQSDYDGVFKGYKYLIYPDDWDKWYIREDVIENTAKLVAYLLHKYNLTDIDSCVLRHYDVTHKECPYPMCGKYEKNWLNFKDRVRYYYSYKNNEDEVENMTKDELKEFIETTVRQMGRGEPASAWAVKEVEEAKRKGITDGSSPLAFATRQEVMCMVNRVNK